MKAVFSLLSLQRKRFKPKQRGMDETDQHATKRKRLLWRANHRGIREMDMVIGGFAASRLGHMSAHELAAFETILDFPDQEMLAWVTKQEAVPPHRASSLLTEILAFRPALQP